MRKEIYIAIIFVVIVAIAIGLVFPAFENFKIVSAKASQKEKELKELEEYLSHIQKISVQLQEYSPQLQKIDQALSQDSYLPNLFDTCQKLAAANGLNLSQVSIGTVTPLKGKENIKEREVNIKVAGQYLNFKNFLIALEKNTRLVEVNKITFSSKSTKEIPQFDLTIKVYSY